MNLSDFRAASYWQFMELFDGWVAAHAPDKKEGLSADETATLHDLATLIGD